MNMKRVGRRDPKKPTDESEQIVIDEAHGLVFSSEEEIYAHFQKEITFLEAEFSKLHTEDDIPMEDFPSYESQLNQLLEYPDEIWETKELLKNQRTLIYIRKFTSDGDSDGVFHVAVCYITNEIPSFVYLHFPTRKEELVAAYKIGDKIFDHSEKSDILGAIEGDALTEGDELAVGLYKAMLRLRGERDIPEAEFPDYRDFREKALTEADEIWRSQDSVGNILVSFIREFDEEDGADAVFFYVVVTVEDAPSGSHALLYSFPTRDTGLVERYRHGENLQAEEVVQEASH